MSDCGESQIVNRLEEKFHNSFYFFYFWNVKPKLKHSLSYDRKRSLLAVVKTLYMRL